MPKSNKLVIVESPAKAKTIEKYLGTGYTVKASMGHLRDLPKSRLGVDIENGFTPQYINLKDKSKLIKELKESASKADLVFLATDPDREGEAISWHLKELLNLPDEKAKRVTFNEITKNVVKSSIKNPRDIDMDLVNAQQARRVLDRLVGYQISPILWKKIKRGLSAGRVQSVAARIVVDREKEISAFIPEEYWLLDAKLQKDDGSEFFARFFGTEKSKIEIKTSEEAEKIAAATSNGNFLVNSVVPTEKKKTPAPPFITSTLQQEASRSLMMSPKRTMAIAQQLYEGVEINGKGSIGLITYMRTDSLRISDEALASAKEFILCKYGEQYYPGNARTFKTRNNAQDAHEAIRPTDVFLTPESVRNDLTVEQYKLYRLIWGRFTASQMACAVYNNTAVDICCGDYHFRCSSSKLVFAGYTSVYEESKDDSAADKSLRIPCLAPGENLNLLGINREQQFTQPPSRYTEATLIRTLEEKGIGRPSTYAPTISTILSHDYVVKEGKYLKPTPLGEVVTEFMKDNFPDIVDLMFTNNMESELDKIESGTADWNKVLKDFYADLDSEIKTTNERLTDGKIPVPPIVSDEVCEICGRQMIQKKGRFGYFLACPGFPECTFTKPIVVEMPGKCIKCGGKILKRTSKTGHVFYACERGKDCGFITWNIPVKECCSVCGKTLFKHSGKGYRKPFCMNPECKNYTPEIRYAPKQKSEDNIEK